MKPKVTTLDNFHKHEIYGRVHGNTTRQVNDAVDLIFKGFCVKCLDHHEDGTHTIANKMLFNRVLKRLSSENNLDHLVKNNKIRIDENKLEIELL